MTHPRLHDTEDNSGTCWCDPMVQDYLDGRRVITHRPPARHVVPDDRGRPFFGQGPHSDLCTPMPHPHGQDCSVRCFCEGRSL